MLSKKLDELGIKNTLHRFNGDVRDFRLDIAQMHAAGTDLYVIRMFEPQINIFIRQLREAGITTPITSIESFNWMEDRSMVEGYWYVDMAGDGDHPVIREIIARNNSDVYSGVAMAYDDVMLIVRAFEAAESRDQAIYRLMEIKEHEGIAGLLTQDEGGIFHSDAAYKIIRGSK
jgi:ABC-type branched-subunit amino acid transport system substrate-binding protein